MDVTPPALACQGPASISPSVDGIALAPRGTANPWIMPAVPERISFEVLKSLVPAESVVEWIFQTQLSRTRRCTCRLHPDADRPDSFGVRADGLLHCFSCHWTGDIIDLVAKVQRVSLGEAARRIADHFGVVAPSGPAPIPSRNGAPPVERKGRAYPSLPEAIAGAQTTPWGQAGSLGMPAVIYPYSAGAFIARYERTGEGGKREKTLRPFSLHADGWRMQDPEGLWPIYNEKAVKAAVARGEPVVLCEGEKCVDLYAAQNIVATTSAHGSGSARKTDWSPLAGAGVVFNPDRDAAGEKYIADVRTCLGKLDDPIVARVLRFDGLADGDDVEQWLAAQPPDLSAADVADTLSRMVAEAPLWAPEAAMEAIEPKDDEIIDRAPQAAREAFYGVLGEAVRLIQPHHEGGAMATLVQLIVAVGNMIGRGPHWMAGFTPHYTNLHTCLVGPTSSGRKGTSGDAVDYIVRDIDPEWTTHRVRDGLSTGEGLIYHVRDGSTETDNRGRAIDDPGVTDKRLLVRESEFGRTLGVMTRPGSTLSAVLRACWDGSNLGNIVRNGSYRATGAHVSVVAHATPEDLRTHLTAVDCANGFANRFLWVYSRRSQYLPFGGDLGSLDLGPIRRDIQTKVEGARKYRDPIGMDPEARDLWKDRYPDLTNPPAGLLGNIVGRGAPQVRRLALIFALMDAWPIVGVDHLKAALAIWDYCFKTALLVFANETGNPDADKILKALRDAGAAGLSKTDIRTTAFGKPKDTKTLNKLLGDLLTEGMIHRKPLKSGGRPKELWFFGPEIKPLS